MSNDTETSQRIGNANETGDLGTRGRLLTGGRGGVTQGVNWEFIESF